MSFNRSQKAAITISFALSGVVAYAVCPPFMYSEAMNTPVFTSTEEAISAALQAGDQMYKQALTNYGNQLTTAIKTLVSQKAVSAKQVSDAAMTAHEQLANQINAVAVNRSVQKARDDYGPEHGQGVRPCEVIATRNDIAEQEAELKQQLGRAVRSEVVAAPGRYGDPVMAQRVLLEAQRNKFCTTAQVQSGFCDAAVSMDKGGGANLSAAVLFEPVMQGEPLHEAKQYFVNNLVGLPDAPVNKGAATTPAAEAYMLQKSRRDALISPAVTTLKDVQLRYSGTATEHRDASIPLAKRYDDEVKRYFGDSAKYKDWMFATTAQNERGMLQEILRQKALDLALMENIYRQYELMEANLANLVSMEVNKSLKVTADGAQKKVSGQAARAAIK